MSEYAAKTSRLSVIVPAYNEAQRLPATLELIRQYAQQTDRSVEVVVIDDGSTDGTADAARTFDPGPLALKVLVNEKNYGKGHAVRRGMLEATGDLRLIYDADGSAPITELTKLLPLVTRTTAIIIGSRDMPDSILDPPQPLTRRLMTRAFRGVRRKIMLPDLQDTQCGFKLFTREAAQEIFSRQEQEGFGFDCEVLELGRKLGYTIREVGILWRNSPQSTVQPLRDSWRMLASLVMIRRRLKRRDWL